MSKLVLVETMSIFRQRYVVEVPEDASWALDTVTCEDAQEFSQEHIGENIFNHRVISKEEYLTLFDQDNSYLKGWSDEHKYSFITRVAQDGTIVKGTEADWKREDQEGIYTGRKPYFPTDCV